MAILKKNFFSGNTWVVGPKSLENEKYKRATPKNSESTSEIMTVRFVSIAPRNAWRYFLCYSCYSCSVT